MSEQWKPLFHLGYEYFEKVISQIDCKVAFDVGANEGDWIQILLNNKAFCVHAFEPLPDMYEKCVSKFENDPRVILSNVAASDKSCSLENMSVFNTWSIAPSGSRQDHVAQYSKDQTFNIKFIRLDDYGVDPDFVKLDVDGYEFRVLKGMEKILKAKRPTIYFEYSYLPREILGDSIKDMCDYIYSLGYAAYSLKGWRCPTSAEFLGFLPENSSYDIMLIPE